MGNRVIIAEIESIIELDIRLHLERLGYYIVAVTKSIEETVKQAGKLQPDFVIIDINLPGSSDGIEASRQIRTFSLVPIVFISSLTDNATIQKLGEIKNSGYVLKPFVIEDLYKAIDTVLDNYTMKV